VRMYSFLDLIWLEKNTQLQTGLYFCKNKKIKKNINFSLYIKIKFINLQTVIRV